MRYIIKDEQNKLVHTLETQEEVDQFLNLHPEFHSEVVLEDSEKAVLSESKRLFSLDSKILEKKRRLSDYTIVSSNKIKDMENGINLNISSRDSGKRYLSRLSKSIDKNSEFYKKYKDSIYEKL